MSSLAETLTALASGRAVVVPTDTVYGLACRPDRRDSVRTLSRLKGRSADQPIALVAGNEDALLELVPELESSPLVRGPFTLVLPNPSRRLPWLTGSRPETIGVRLPEVDGVAAEWLDGAGVVAATSANRHGGADPRRVADVPSEILGSVGAALDGGELPGLASTVIDLTGAQPVVLREGAVAAREALARVARERSE